MQRLSMFRTVFIAGAMTMSLATVAQLPSKVGDTPVPSLAPMIKRVSPAVVNIATKATVQQQQRNPLLDDPFFRRYFDVPEQGQGQRPRQAQAAGSGVIVDAKNGYILTNAHVIDGATEVTVTLLDNRTLKAEIVGSDKGSDVAVLKVKGTNLIDMPLADSSKTEVGDFVVAIGNPFGLQHTVTSGIVSALGRVGVSPDGRDAYEDFIQTDAAINPGNSGGALVNLAGELVGVNSAILSQSGGNIGIGFAIPSNMVKSIMDQLVKYKTVKRGRLGISIGNLSPELAQSYGLSGETTGALVSEVQEGSAAEKAGIKAADVITAINGKTVKNASELRNSIGLMRIGDKVEVSLVRDGKPRKLTAIVGEGDNTVTAGNAGEIHPGFEGAELGDSSEGVVVKAVAAGSPAAQRRLRANDVIIAVGRTRVTTVAQLRTNVEKATAFALTIKRGNATVVVVMDGN